MPKNDFMSPKAVRVYVSVLVAGHTAAPYFHNIQGECLSVIRFMLLLRTFVIMTEQGLHTWVQIANRIKSKGTTEAALVLPDV